jgi:hypothetical protein
MENIDNVFEFAISRILDLGYSIDESVNIGDDNIKLGYAMDFRYEVANNWVEFVIKTEFSDASSGTVFLSGSTLTRFSIKKLDSFFKGGTTFSFPENSMETLFGIAFTHMRAMLSKNCGGSKFQWIIVPAVDPKKVFNELLQINIAVFEKLNSEKEKV